MPVNKSQKATTHSLDAISALRIEQCLLASGLGLPDSISFRLAYLAQVMMLCNDCQAPAAQHHQNRDGNKLLDGLMKGTHLPARQEALEEGHAAHEVVQRKESQLYGCHARGIGRERVLQPG